MSHQPDAPTGETSSSGWRPSRRVMVKAATAFAALAAAGGVARSGLGLTGAKAQQSGGTLARRWVEADNVTVAEANGARTIAAEFPFYAVGGSWDGSFGTGAVLEF